MITREELTERQGWSYDQKIDHALYVIDTFIHRTGGKCFMVLDHNAKSAVLIDLVWRIERSICGVYPNRFKGHKEEYEGYPIFPTRAAEGYPQTAKYLQRGQCATYEADGAEKTECYPLSIWMKEDIERYIRNHADLRRFIRNNPND